MYINRKYRYMYNRRPPQVMQTFNGAAIYEQIDLLKQIVITDKENK